MAGSPRYPNNEAVKVIADENSDPFEQISRLVLSVVSKKGGKLQFCDVEHWAESAQIGKYTLRTIVSDLIAEGKLCAPDGFAEGGDDFEPSVPRSVELPRASSQDITEMKKYLGEYWSVGELRLFEDMLRMGMQDVNEVLKTLLEEGYAVLTPSNVINATAKLLKEEKAARITVDDNAPAKFPDL